MQLDGHLDWLHFDTLDLWTIVHALAFKVVRDSFGSNKMCQFFCQNLLFMAQAVRKWNNIRGSQCSIFQKMGPNIAIFDLLKGEVRRKMNFTYVLGFVVLRDVVKVFPVSSSSFARKTTGRNRARVTRGHDAAWRRNGISNCLFRVRHISRYLFI